MATNNAIKYKNIIFILLAFLLFSLSYMRDTLFVLINASIEHKPYNYANTAIPGFLKQLSIPDLKKLKWVLAAIFTCLFTLISTGALHIYFRNMQYTRFVFILYILLIISSLISELIIYFIDLPRPLINALHAPETIIQSPLVLLFVFPVFIFYEIRNRV